MWNALRDICRREHASLNYICTAIAVQKPANSSLTAAIRVFIMAYFKAAATEDGHDKAGHGPGGRFTEFLGKARVTMRLAMTNMRPPSDTMRFGEKF